MEMGLEIALVAVCILAIISSAIAIVALRECYSMNQLIERYYGSMKHNLDSHILAQSNINVKVSNRLDGITKRLNIIRTNNRRNHEQL